MLVLVQYGETAASVDKVMMGQRDTVLSTNGLRTAEQYAEALGGIQFNQAFVADSVPGRTTLSEIMLNQVTSPKFEMLQELIEPSGGAYEGLSYAFLKKELPPREYRLWDRDYFIPAGPGGESLADLSERVLRWFRSQSFTGNTLIVVGPSVMKVLLGHLQNLEESEIVDLEPHLIPYSFET
jgi:broad specificity phosphatase PhoE